MKNNKNKKGMTLVEVIIAMSVFAIVTSGFMMTAVYCIKAQTKAQKRLNQSNGQTTEIENFKGLYDDYAGSGNTDIEPFNAGSNEWSMKFTFPEGSYTADHIHGFYYSNDGNYDDDTFDLQFFSPDDTVDLAPGEYWVSLYNNSGDQVTWDITCDSGFVFFDNEGQVYTSLSTIPTRIVDDGARIKFGIKDIGGGDLSNALTISDWDGNSSTIGLAPYTDADRYSMIYYTAPGSFLTADQYDATI